MLDALRPYIARIIAAAIAAGIGALATKLGIDATSVDQAALAGSLGTFITLAIFSVVHKLIDKKVNPVDAASTPEVKAGVVEARRAAYIQQRQS